MEIRFDLTGEDQRVFIERLRSLRPRRDFGALLALGAASLALAGAGGLVLGEAGYADWQVAEVFLIAALFALACLVDHLCGRFGGWVRPARLAGDWELSLTPAGLAVTRRGQPEFVPWPEILAFEETEDYWFLYRNASGGFPVPRRAVPEPDGRAAFVEKLRCLWALHPGSRGRVLPEHVEGIRDRWRTLADLGVNLRGGYRFAVFRAVTATDFRANPAQLAILLALQLLWVMVADYLTAGPDPRFDAHGFNDYGATVVLFLLGGVAIGGLLSGMGNLLKLLVVLAASEQVVFAVYFLAYNAIRQARLDAEWTLLWGLYAAWMLWNLVLVFRAVVLLYDCRRPAALLPVSLYAVFNLALAHALPDQAFFAPAGDDAPQSAKSADRDIDGEDLIYRQPELLGAAVRALAGGRPGVTDLYFVGFAGEADEHVFAHEIEYARELFDRRFGTAGRSVALVNSPDTADRLALANSHNLEAVLQAVAARMDPDEDVLFLFLTSHGSADHRLSVQFPSLPLNDLSADRLKELLDRSGIRNRVIVVSACYSGGFLDVLKDDNSLILTAASRDRTSFGCGTESEFTYFGQAYFAEALQQTRSFIDAFGQARMWIEAREKGEGKDPSMPQLHVGAGILPKLRALEAGSKS